MTRNSLINYVIRVTRDLNYSLRPIEWYNLVVLHSPKQFLLHDDFYGEDGQAQAFQSEEDVIDALKQHDQQKILDSVQIRFDETQHAQVKSRMLEIAADVLSTSAAEWVRELLDQADEEFLYPLSWAQPAAYQEMRVYNM
ncbi:hypothetical protein C6W20_04830 [Bacillus sp. NMCN6]|uniref:hypothetical protein n=1 Tax=Bacillus sp. NMCN6 TaxID=2108535 RepID=UPI000D034FDC|nr:hypothetical protein [Bacillus sp. NMCN6]PRS00349.1 hypothetical protein C6W20_04830 [Bacillus sp. NMCN6]